MLSSKKLWNYNVGKNSSTLLFPPCYYPSNLSGIIQLHLVEPSFGGSSATWKPGDCCAPCPLAADAPYCYPPRPAPSPARSDLVLQSRPSEDSIDARPHRLRTSADRLCLLVQLVQQHDRPDDVRRQARRQVVVVRAGRGDRVALGRVSSVGLHLGFTSSGGPWHRSEDQQREALLEHFRRRFAIATIPSRVSLPSLSTNRSWKMS